MNEDEIRQVPTLSEPPDRATTRRRRRTGSAVLAAVAGAALVGAVLSIPAPDSHLATAAARPNGPTMTPAAPSTEPTATTRPSVSTFANPAVSQAYVTVSPEPDTYPNDVPPRDAPLPLPGTCPTSVDPMRLPVHNPWDATTWPRRVKAVTLCRYEHSTFDTSEGHNTLTQGPVTGELAVFAAALDKALPPVRPIDHAGCRVANSGPPYTIDIVFVTASGDTGKAYLMLRTLCDPPWLKNPERTLQEAVDAVLGSPY